MSDLLRITSVEARPISIPLRETFTISRGSVKSAESAFVRVTLSDDTVGYGECAPFPPVTGEDQAGTIAAVERLIPLVIEQPVAEIERLGGLMQEAEPGAPAARCGLETALLDALCRACEVTVWRFFGARNRGPFVTDITLPILGRERCLTLAGEWYAKGFRRFKIKVGQNLDDGLAVIREIAARCADVAFVIDANQGFAADDAAAFVQALNVADLTVRMLEQPVAAEDLGTMARLRSIASFPICADEAVATSDDCEQVIAAQAADIINIKIMKSGVIEGRAIARRALAAGLDVMFGGMIETRLAMGCSLSLAGGLGAVRHLDLDTPLLMADDPIRGGYTYDGPEMGLVQEPGLGATPAIFA